MSITIEDTGFGAYPFGTEAFGTGIVYAHSGLEFDAKITKSDPEGLEFDAKITVADPEGLEFDAKITASDPEGLEFDAKIVDFASPQGLEFDAQIVDAVNPEGLEYDSKIVDFLGAQGLQFNAGVLESLGPQGLQFFASNLGFDCNGFGTYPFGTLPFGTEVCNASAGVEFFAQPTNFPSPQGLEFDAFIQDRASPQGLEFDAKIADALFAQGLEFFSSIVDFAAAQGVEFDSKIVDKAFPQGLEFDAQITVSHAEGLEFSSIISHAEGLEFRVVLYNNHNLRVLCSFTSRGAETGSGNNAWGNPIATGANWKTNSVNAAIDYEIANVNSDIVEQTYRSQIGTITGINLDCDVETEPGTFLDTFAILNHNLTSSASITLIGSTLSDFSVIGKTINIQSRVDNIYHIEEFLPEDPYRYWRLQISDPTNTNTFIEIGTILFGEAIIFTADECMNDNILKKPIHFFDSVRTEGFSSVKNNRSLKNRISMTFESLRWDKGNWQKLDGIFKDARTSLKCLWIPTPSVTRPEITERFAVFGKITELPEEQHNVKGSVGEDLDYITVNFDVSEAE